MNIINKICKLQQYELGWTDYKLAQEANIPQSSLATLYARQTPHKLEMLQHSYDAFDIAFPQFFLKMNK